jgi:hypothetical protein
MVQNLYKLIDHSIEICKESDVRFGFDYVIGQKIAFIFIKNGMGDSIRFSISTIEKIQEIDLLCDALTEKVNSLLENTHNDKISKMKGENTMFDYEVSKMVKEKEKELTLKHPMEATYNSKQTLWSCGLNDGIVSETQYDSAKKHYGDIWNYCGD